MRSNVLRRARMRNRFFAVLCHVLGLVILLSVIFTALSIFLPRLLGYQVYHVDSPSMSPAIPVGSVIYVAQVTPEELQPEDVVAYFGESGSVITHRVLRNQTVEGSIITKGDANPREDAVPVSYSAVIGRVTMHIPLLGRLLQFYVSEIGKLYALSFAACGVMFYLLAGRLKDRIPEEEPEEDMVSDAGEAQR